MRRTSSALALFAAAVTLAGCSSAAESPARVGTPGASSPSASPTQSEPGAGIDVTVIGKTVTPAPATIDAAPGEEFTVTLTTDRTGELHVHAADPEFEAETAPGTKAYTFTLTEIPGIYEVELHDPDLLLFEIKVQ